MALAFSSLEVSPTKGLMQIADRRILAQDQWLTLDNVVLDQAGAVRKRDGYGALPQNVTVAGSLLPGGAAHPVVAQGTSSGLWARGDELVSFDSDGVGTYVDSWSPSRNVWLRQDEACELSHKVSIASSIYGYQTDAQTKAVTSFTTTRTARIHACFQSPDAGGTQSLVVNAVDADTGDVMIADSFTHTGGAPKVYRLLRFQPAPGLDSYAWVLGWTLANTSWQRVDPFAATIGPEVGFTGANPSIIVDAHELGDTRFAVATWRPAGPSVIVDLYDTATGAPVAVTTRVFILAGGHTAQDVSIHGVAGVGIVVAWREMPAGDIVVAVMDATTLAVTWGPTAIATGSVVLPSGRSWVSCAIGGNEVAVTWNEGTLPLLLTTDSLRFARRNATTGAAIGAGRCANVSALTRPARSAGRWFVACVTNAYDGDLGGSTQHNPPDASAILLRLDPVVGGAPQLAGVAHVEAVPIAYTPTPTSWQPTDLDDALVFDSPQAVRLSGPGTIGTRVLSVALEPATANSHARQAVGSQACLALSGAFAGWYDGTSYSELTFAQRPQLIGIQIGGAGAVFAPGGYDYAVVYEWYDEEGNLHQSEPSYITPAVVTVAAASIFVSIATLGPTNKGDIANSQFRPVQIAVFRTLRNGTQLIRIFPQQQGIPNDPSVNYILFTDTVPDATLLANAYGNIYTFGGTLPSQTMAGPPVVTTHGGRVWMVDPADTKAVLFSKGLVSGEAPGFNRELVIRLDDSPEGVEAMASMDDKLVLFTATRIYYVSGEGPGDTGAGAPYQVVRIAADGGCVDPRSVLGFPNGVFYQSSGGLRKLDRGLSDSEVGEVRQLFGKVVTVGGYGHDAPIVLASCLDVKRRRCRWLTQRTDTSASGSTQRTVYVVYDYGLNIWTTEEPWVTRGTRQTDLAVASGFWQDKHVQAITIGVVVQGTNTNPGCDGSTFFQSTMRTPWFHAGAIAGYQRATWLTLVGERSGYCGLVWNVYVNYVDSVAQTHRFDLSSTSTVVGRPNLELELHIRPQRAPAHSFEIYDEPVSGTDLPGFGGVLVSALRLDIGAYPHKALVSPLNKG